MSFPYDWYWLVGSEIYSSRKQAVVPENDADYLLFQASEIPTRIASYEELDAVLKQYNLPGILPPTVITPRQARLILHRNGLLTAVNNLVASLGPEAELEWEFCNYVERSNPVLNAVATAAGMTQAQLDTMFKEASTL